MNLCSSCDGADLSQGEPIIQENHLFISLVVAGLSHGEPILQVLVFCFRVIMHFRIFIYRSSMQGMLTRISHNIRLYKSTSLNKR